MCNSVRRNFAHRWVAFSRIGKYFVGGCLAPIMPHSCRCRALGKTTLGRMPSKLRVRRVLQSKDSATSKLWPRFTLLTMAFFSCKINPTTGVNVANRIPARRCYFRAVRHVCVMLKALHLLKSVQSCDVFARKFAIVIAVSSPSLH